MTAVGRAGTSLERLLADFDSGKKPALARAVSIVENRRQGADDLLAHVHSRVGRARRVGITGPPGAGKSTMTASIAAAYRSTGLTVGIVAVDPTSPFTGGALLGDRIRMEAVALDPGVFIRSMATRGSLGGLATATREVADVVDAFGVDRLIIETVGVGQSELDVARIADSTVVVLVPESGDSIQTLKAGLMEIADVFVVNKADRQGADRLRQELQLMIRLRRGDASGNVPAHHGVQLNREKKAPPPADDRWAPPVLRSVAIKGEGVAELIAATDLHFDYLDRSGELVARRRTRLRDRVIEIVERKVRTRLWGDGRTQLWLDGQLDALQSGDTNPFIVADELLAVSGDLLTRVTE